MYAIKKNLRFIFLFFYNNFHLKFYEETFGDSSTVYHLWWLYKHLFGFYFIPIYLILSIADANFFYLFCNWFLLFTLFLKAIPGTKTGTMKSNNRYLKSFILIPPQYIYPFFRPWDINKDAYLNAKKSEKLKKYIYISYVSMFIKHEVSPFVYRKSATWLFPDFLTTLKES